ncbi:D-Ala-D-Ala carboxypeptidase family metallohydrolase [Phreatobacter stygius]|uniref:D-Ala-D-Ala carboxypeptidase family metallohydrolase n=1 Tax=Phreatobacter stygius TaxID=1940610 RepID=UPI001476B8BF|nr:D-Ala-D-Ala carboxypeptidase family metallohydrolase [Phreatobacter stygius]
MRTEDFVSGRDTRVCLPAPSWPGPGRQLGFSWSRARHASCGCELNEEAEMTNVVLLPLRPRLRSFGVPRVSDRSSPNVVPLLTVWVARAPAVTTRTLETRYQGPANRPRAKRAAVLATDIDEFAKIPIERAFGYAVPRPVSDLADDETGRFDLRLFRSFALGLDLRYFTAEDLLCLGPGDASAAIRAGLGHPPPVSLWPNIAETARMLDQISHRLAARCTILSAYRNGPYNARVGGGKSSPHLWFNAIDFRCAKGVVADWRRVAAAVRAGNPRFKGSIGCHRDFLHIDTRGVEADW